MILIRIKLELFMKIMKLELNTSFVTFKDGKVIEFKTGATNMPK